MSEIEVKSIRDGVLEVFRTIDRELEPDHAGSLVEQSVLDSLNILDLIEGLEQHFGIEFDDASMTLQSFESLDRIELLVHEASHDRGSGI